MQYFLLNSFFRFIEFWLISFVHKLFQWEFVDFKHSLMFVGKPEKTEEKSFFFSKRKLGRQENEIS